MQGKAEDAGGLTPAKDDNAAMRTLYPRAFARNSEDCYSYCITFFMKIQPEISEAELDGSEWNRLVPGGFARSVRIGQFNPKKNRSMRHTIFGDVMTRLKELRRERGYTQIKMQMLTGIDQSDYSKLETGKRYYTYEQLRRIALALDTSMDYLAELTDDPRPYPRRKQK